MCTMGKLRFVAVTGLLLLNYHEASSFTPSTSFSNRMLACPHAHYNRCRSTCTRTTTTTHNTRGIKTCRSGLSMVADKLSAECVGAIMTAHEIGNDIGLSVLRNEILFAGIVGMPERAALTLEKYNMSYEKVKETAIAQVRKSVSDLVEGGNNSRDALPFSAASTLLMDQALTIAEGLNCPSVRSEHVLLALMGYNNGKPIESAPALDVLSNIPGLRGVDGKAFSCFKFCEQLMLDLDTQPDSDMSTGIGMQARETVAINRGGLGLGTSTLNSIGVDLTQLALEGKLDNVYGRDAEIRSALRTLGRRRKNNPCLIGGKLSLCRLLVGL